MQNSSVKIIRQYKLKMTFTLTMFKNFSNLCHKSAYIFVITVKAASLVRYVGYDINKTFSIFNAPRRIYYIILYPSKKIKCFTKNDTKLRKKTLICIRISQQSKIVDKSEQLWYNYTKDIRI